MASLRGREAVVVQPIDTAEKLGYESAKGCRVERDIYHPANKTTYVLVGEDETKISRSQLVIPRHICHHRFASFMRGMAPLYMTRARVP